MTSQSLHERPLALPALSTERLQWVRQAGRALAANWAQWRHRSEGRRYLACMDDRMLKDIGVSRAGVFQERKKWMWQP